jgi:hypothetical protein
MSDSVHDAHRKRFKDEVSKPIWTGVVDCHAQWECAV